MAPPTARIGTIPPPLPPSVEEAYRRKCIQLKQRLNEVDEANDGARLRLARMHRAIDKVRLERAFLLEQLAKRTSTNVEDSEGSPSPPPTPKEKPLRTKRGHRKPSFLANLSDTRPGSAFIQQQGNLTISPSSDAFSHTHAGGDRDGGGGGGSARSVPRSIVNGGSSRLARTPKRPTSAFDVYCDELRSVLMVRHRQEIADGKYDVDEGLATGWGAMPRDKRLEFEERLERAKETYDHLQLMQRAAASGTMATTSTPVAKKRGGYRKKGERVSSSSTMTAAAAAARDGEGASPLPAASVAGAKAKAEANGGGGGEGGGSGRKSREGRGEKTTRSGREKPEKRSSLSRKEAKAERTARAADQDEEQDEEGEEQQQEEKKKKKKKENKRQGSEREDDDDDDTVMKEEADGEREAAQATQDIEMAYDEEEAAAAEKNDDAEESGASMTVNDD